MRRPARANRRFLIGDRRYSSCTWRLLPREAMPSGSQWHVESSRFSRGRDGPEAGKPAVEVRLPVEDSSADFLELRARAGSGVHGQGFDRKACVPGGIGSI